MSLSSLLSTCKHDSDMCLDMAWGYENKKAVKRKTFLSVRSSLFLYKLFSISGGSICFNRTYLISKSTNCIYFSRNKQTCGLGRWDMVSIRGIMICEVGVELMEVGEWLISGSVPSLLSLLINMNTPCCTVHLPT